MAFKATDIAWLAGLIEGEGSIFGQTGTTDRARSRWIFSLEMTDKDVVERAAKIWGHGSVRQIPARQRPHALGRKDIYVWRFENRAQVYALLAAIYPWLGNRRKAKAKEALLDLAPVTSFQRKANKWLVSSSRQS